MATTNIHPIVSTLIKAIDYILDDSKTNNGLLVSAYGCPADAHGAAESFELVRSLGTGRTKTLAQHLIQSFLPGEVMPEQAHKIAQEMCEKLLGTSFQYIIATHTDKAHVHSHIIINNIDMEENKSFETLLNRHGKVFEKIREISDQICEEHGLSVIKNPQLGKGKSHYEWEQDKLGKSWKSQLKRVIDQTIMESNGFDDFLSKLRDKSVEVVYTPEKTIKIKFRLPDQQRYARGRTLGWYYDVPQIKRRIEQSYLLRTGKPLNKQRTKIIDTSTERMQKSRGLQRWADIQNMKEASKILNMLTSRNIGDQQQLEDRAVAVFGERVRVVGQLESVQARINDITDSIRIINQYHKYKPVKDEYRRTRAKKKIENSHQRELQLFDSAVAELDTKYPDHKVPSIDKLRDDKVKLKIELSELNERYKKIAAELKELDYIRQTIQDYLDHSTTREKPQTLI